MDTMGCMNILRTIDYNYFANHPIKDEMRNSVKKAVGMKARIANAYTNGDLKKLASILIEINSKLTIVKKNTTSPIYTISEKPSNILKLSSIIETAMFLLVNDEETPNQQVSDAYEILRKSNYSLKEKLFDAFQHRLKSDNDYGKMIEVINKLQILGEELGFSH